MQPHVRDFGHQFGQINPQHNQQALLQSQSSHQVGAVNSENGHPNSIPGGYVPSLPAGLPPPPNHATLPPLAPPPPIPMTHGHQSHMRNPINHGYSQQSQQEIHQSPATPSLSRPVHHKSQQSMNKSYSSHNGYDGFYAMHMQHQNQHTQQMQHSSQSDQASHNQVQGDRDSDDGGANHSGDGVDDADGNEASRLGKRKRPLTVSCEICKQRKVKCDRIQPSCSWCTKNSVLCEYRQRKKPGLRAGYGRELEQRLDILEKQLIEHKAMFKQHEDLINSLALPAQNQIQPSGPAVKERSRSIVEYATTPGGTTNTVMAIPSIALTPRASGPQVSSQDHGDSRTPNSADTPIPKTESEVYNSASYISMDLSSGYSGVHAEYPGHSPIEYTKQRIGNVEVPHQSSPVQQWICRQTDIERDLPPYSILYSIIDRYFGHINTWCPILHRKTTLDNIFSKPLDEADRILIHAILATTLRYCDDLITSAADRKRYYDISKQRVLLYGMENSTVKSIQALVILALDLVGRSNGCSGRNILALLARSVVQLGLAVEANLAEPTQFSIYTLRTMILPEPVDFIEEEARRRVFWMVYLLDRYATTATAFDFVLSDHEIDRMLPCKDELWDRCSSHVQTRFFYTSKSTQGHQQDPNAKDNMGAFAYYLEILGILSKIHQFLKRPVDIQLEQDVKQWQKTFQDLQTEFDTWKKNLPPEYGDMSRLQRHSVKLLSPSWVMLHAAYQTTVIRLNSSAAYPTIVSSYFQVSRYAASCCLQAVDEIKKLTHFVVDQRMLAKFGPPFAFTLWVAARVILVDSTTITGTIDDKLGFFTDTLREMGRYWPVSKRYSELLQRVLDEHRANPDEKPAAVRILADMRRTAFDLDILLSRPANKHSHPNGNGPGPTGAIALVRPCAASMTPNRLAEDLDAKELFDFFNYPRPNPDFFSQGINGGVVGADRQMVGDMGGSMPYAIGDFGFAPDMVVTDWLYPRQENIRY